MNTKTLWRWMLTLVAAIALTASFTACGDDDDNENDGSSNSRYPLTGYWTSDDPDEDYGVLFNADGSGDWSEPFEDYKVEDGHLYIMWDYDGDYEDEGAIKIAGNKFRLYNPYEDYWTTYTRQ